MLYDTFRRFYTKRVRRLFYIQYLYEYGETKLIRQCILPDEIYEEHYITTAHYDVEQYKDYSCGSRRITTDRYYSHETKKTLEKINHKNLMKYLELVKENKYQDYKRNGKFVRVKFEMKDDTFYEKIFDVGYKYKYFVNEK